MSNPSGPICSGCHGQTLRLRVTRGTSTEYVKAGLCDECGVIVTSRRVLLPGRAEGQAGLFAFGDGGERASS